jgi:hypothetical protein
MGVRMGVKQEFLVFAFCRRSVARPKAMPEDTQMVVCAVNSVPQRRSNGAVLVAN